VGWIAFMLVIGAALSYYFFYYQKRNEEGLSQNEQMASRS